MQRPPGKPLVDRHEMAPEVLDLATGSPFLWKMYIQSKPGFGTAKEAREGLAGSNYEVAEGSGWKRLGLPCLDMKGVYDIVAVFQ